jgi:cell shape-determining protein MreD
VDLFLALALAYGLTAPVHDARIGAWIIGFVQDLGAADALGIHAFALGLTGLLLTSLRAMVNLDLWWVRLLVAIPAAWAGAALYLLHLHLWSNAPFASWWTLLASSAWTAFVAALAAAIVTAYPQMITGRRRRVHLLTRR